ncbi:glycosyl transferase family 2 [Desulfotomaculum nigrificans CO-1-SRB]|uniref:Glycosyl transferase family 2 n=1 Tax=Desulfotomaculum nigrificans (strain DSM 14880 / VKM B-2319 / CO-1-SRB) TaxID=868595 RepID=F6B5K3_DESCC|nr:glycosyl transferase family 2 [Desulfotomaculum nigrificans CO-1-SRB]
MEGKFSELKFFRKAGVLVIKPAVTLIIPTLNGAGELPVLLEQISLQTVKAIEVIIIDSQSTDKTTQVAESYGAQIITIGRDEFDHGATRNLAVTKAKGDIVIFMTQDAVPANEETIGNLIKPLEQPDIIVSYARQLPKAGTKVTDKFLRLYNYPAQSKIKSKEDIPALGIGTFQNSNVCAAYRRAEFEKLGGFPQPTVSNEDMLFAAKAILAGYKVAYTAEAMVLHSHNYNCRQLFKRYFDIGASLDNAPFIKQVGKAESKGLDFICNQLKFVHAESGLVSVPAVFFEALCKYAGYKLGVNHCLLPKVFKKYLGLQKGYWTRVANNTCNAKSWGKT